jgi:subtilisin family serine protease
VADTGFDDASCFLVDDPSTRASLTGDFNSGVQMARSLYDSPTTDLSRRKIVQYIKRSDSDDSFGYDYANGHGTHVAGTVAGSISDSDSRSFTENFSGIQTSL